MKRGRVFPIAENNVDGLRDVCMALGIDWESPLDPACLNGPPNIEMKLTTAAWLTDGDRCTLSRC